MPLNDLRYRKYCAIMASQKKNLKPEYLPPTESAADQHILRAFIQSKDWMLLDSMTSPPTDFGWTQNADGIYEPVGSLEEYAPLVLRDMTACKCKVGCGNRCRCKQSGLSCIDACLHCRGETCTNSREETINEDDVN